MELKKVICETHEQFHEECLKWVGKRSVIRGRQLIVYGEVVAELVSNRGGYRPGSGRKPEGRTKAVTFRISKEAASILDKCENKSAFIDDLIKSTAAK